MSSEEGRKWVTVETDEDKAAALAAELSIPGAVAQVLVSRGLSDSDVASRFLNPRLSDLSDPFEIAGMAAAVDRIWKAIDDGERITVFGDYDADGVSSTALMVLALRELGVEPDFYVPSRREDGYGLTVDALSKVIDATKPDLVITVDCGTTAVDAVAMARDRGVDVVVTDHHENGHVPLPDAVAVVNPKLGGDDDVAVLSGVGVAFKLCHGLVKRGSESDRPGVQGLDLRNFLDLVALGTVADVVPLIGENRTLVRHGLKSIRALPRCGMQALLRVASVRTVVDCYHLGFLIGPRINAAGRLASAEPALNLLLSDNPGKAKRLAGQLDAYNRERKRIEEQIAAEAVDEIDPTFDEDQMRGIVVGREGWHAGTIGIVAARLCGRYKRPAVVIAFDENGFGRGSCRSVDSVDVVAALAECEALLETFGGHKAAAGLSIQRENLDAFRDAFNAACAAQVAADDLVATYAVDAWITLGEADDMLLEAVNSLRPLGLGNPTPTWGARGVRVVGRPQVVGKNHLKMTVSSGGTQMDAIAFGMAGRDLHEGELDLLFHVQENNYMGRRSIQLNVKDFRPSQN